jgi:hypothetical protein
VEGKEIPRALIRPSKVGEPTDVQSLFLQQLMEHGNEDQGAETCVI